jgi:uncharacterized protein
MKIAMLDLIEQRRDRILELCRQYGVARLELFGSAATGRFNPRSSDLDFMVEFQPGSPLGPFRQYFDFLADLKSALGREVDLVEACAMKNPYFIKSANQTKVLLYAA